MELELTLSGNDIGVPQEVPVDSQVDNLILTVYIEGPDYTESLDNLSGQLDRIIELLEYQQEMMISQNALPDEEPEEEEEKEIVVNVTVSENTISENTVSENALLTTKLTEYSLTDSLLLVICLLLLFFIVVSLFFRKGESN